MALNVSEGLVHSFILTALLLHICKLPTNLGISLSARPDNERIRILLDRLGDYLNNLLMLDMTPLVWILALVLTNQAF